jgi:2-aminoethylphosphonate aminotransferase
MHNKPRFTVPRPVTYKLSVKNAGKILKKYRGFLSKKDLGKILSLSLANPGKDLETVTEKFLEKKYSIDKIETLLESANKSYYTHKDIMKKLGISRSRFYFRLNYIKRFVIKKKFEWILKKGGLTKLPHDATDMRRITGLLKNKPLERKILLNPGPVLTSLGVKNALVQNDICHRDEDFEILMKRLKRNSLRIFDADENYSVVFISGSGTAGMEAAISSTIPSDKKILVLANGAFGERLYEIAKLHKLKTVLMRKEWGELFDITEVEDALKADKDIFAIAMNHHETSVGILNPINKVGRLARKYDKMFIVDGISSVGGEPLSVRNDNIDVCITSANKCLHGFSGMNLICVNNRVWKLIENVEPRSFYLDLKKYQKYSTQLNQTPYTPAVAVFFALDQAIRELLEKGMKKRWLRYIELNSILKYELSRLGFQFFTNYDCQSHAILTVKIPEYVDFKQFYSEIKKAGFIIYPCKPPLAEKYFQIANMGELRRGMIYDFIFTVEKTLDKMRKEKARRRK